MSPGDHRLWRLLSLLALALLLPAAAVAASESEGGGGDFPEGRDIGVGDDETGDDKALIQSRSGGGGVGGGGEPGGASAELAGEAALGGLRRRLELDGALAEAVRAGHAAADQLRRQAAELGELRAENARLRAAVAGAAAAKRAAASGPAMVAPPAGVDAERDRDLAQLAGLLAHPDRTAKARDDDAPDNEEAAGGVGCFPAGTPLADCAQVRRRFGLALDAEAAAICDSHRLCAACAASYGIEPSACDRAYVAVAAGLCLKESDPVRCGRQADALLAAMRAAHAPADPVAAGVIGCQRPCAARLLATVRGK